MGSKRVTKEELNKKLFERYNGEYEIIDNDYKTVNDSTLFRHNMPDGTSHPFMSIPYNFTSKKGCSCGVCSGRQVFKGYNDLNTLRPDLTKYLKNPEDGDKVTIGSNQRIDFYCKKCGHLLNATVSHFVNDEVSCPACSDGVSYPNKLMLNILLQFDNLEFENEWCPSWARYELNDKIKKCLYDFYLPTLNLIIEMDGGFHYIDNKLNGITKEEMQNIDRMKNELAEQHNITMIRINCIQSDYELIKKNILTSKLNTILDFTKIDFDQAHTKSLNSNVVNAINMWDQGWNTNQIAEVLHIKANTVARLLNKAAKYGLCDYTGVKGKARSVYKRVRCVNYNTEFESIMAASKYYDIDNSDVGKCCNGKRSFGGTFNGEKLIFEYI